MIFQQFVEENMDTLVILFRKVKELNQEITFDDFCTFVYNNTY